MGLKRAESKCEREKEEREKKRNNERAKRNSRVKKEGRVLKNYFFYPIQLQYQLTFKMVL